LFTILAWHFSVPHDRYLTNSLPFSAFLLAFSIQQLLLLIDKQKIANLTLQVLYQAVLCISVGVFLVYVSHLQHHIVRLTHPIEALTSRKPMAFRAYTAANQIIKNNNDPLLNLFFPWGLFFFNGKNLGNWIGPVRYSDFCTEPPTASPKECHLISPTDMVEKLKQLNTRLLLVNTLIVRVPTDYLTYFKIEYQDETALLFSLKKDDSL
jgi:hypothetical protein